MPSPTPFDFFAPIYPDPFKPGRLALRTRTHRAGTEHTHWCCGRREVARLVQKYRRTRSLSFSFPLHDHRTALAIARQRRKRATPGMVRGIEASVTAVPALWALVPVGARGAGLPEDLQAVAGLLAAVPRPTIVAETPDGVLFAWLLRDLWVMESDDDLAEARGLLRRVQWAIESAAADRGWRLPPDGDLARMVPLPATLARFPLAPGEDRYRRRDFVALGEAPPIDRGAWPAPREAPAELTDVRRVRAGCAWFDACLKQAATIGRRAYRAVMTVLGNGHVPGGAGPWDLAHDFSSAHPGYDVFATDEELRRAQQAPHGPRTCGYVGQHLDAFEEFCRGCVNYGRVESPWDLGRPSKPAALREVPAREQRSPNPGSSSPPLKKGELEGDSLPMTAQVVAPSPSSILPAHTSLHHLLGDRPILVVLPGEQPVLDLPLPEPANPAPAYGGALGAFFAGLRDLLPRLGGTASARQIVDALSLGADCDLPLRRALEAVFPHLPRGALPSPRELGYRLKSLAGREAGGLTLIQGAKGHTGITWSVRGAAENPEPLIEKGAA